MTATSPNKMKVAIITPVFNEEASLATYEDAVRRVLLSREEYDFKFLLIEDGSQDGSWRIIEDMARRDKRFCGFRLSRNFGAHAALSAGFAFARGDAVATLPCDLQDPPETVLEFLAKWRQGARIVWGHRRSRDEGAWRGIVSRIFFHLVRRFAMPRGSKFSTGSFLLADQQVVECYRQFREHNRITFALMAWTGFDQAVVDYDRGPRLAGKSGWGFGKRIKAMYDTFVGFSFLPIRLMTWAGIVAFLFSLVLSAYYVICWATRARDVPGYASTIVSITFLFGVQFLFMGITGEYLYRVYAEAVRRPLYFVSQTTDPEIQDPHVHPHSNG